MAASYSVVSQQRTVQVISPTLVRDVQQVGINTHPTGVYLEYPIDLIEWRATLGAGTLGAIAEQVEGMIANTPAVAASFLEDVDDNGLLVGFLDVVVAYDPPDNRPRMTTAVLIDLDTFAAASDPFFGRLAGAPEPTIYEAYDKLVATANL